MIQQPLFWLILLVSVPVYWLLPAKYRPGFLAAASFGFLLTLDVRSSVSLLVFTIAFYLLGPRLLEGRRGREAVLAALILVPLAYLAFFKYIPPLIGALGGSSFASKLPFLWGISYYTFKLIHYAAEVARGNITDRSAQNFLCYMFLFPIFTAGPIERFEHFLANRQERWQLDTTVEGLTRIVQGLVKKLVLAELILTRLQSGFTADTLLPALPSLSVARVWSYLIVSYLKVYLDFSAYSDIAIGCSLLFGIRIMENFNWPVLAHNIGEFWRRWHITLSNWCEVYVYMPVLGLWRRPYLAIYACFVAIGLWHAGTLTRLCWGLYHGTGVAAFTAWSRYKRKKKWKTATHGWRKWLAVLGTQAFVCVGTVFLVTEVHHKFYESIRLFAKLFGLNV